jgi:probable HAF family extracellular repeat protein
MKPLPLLAGLALALPSALHAQAPRYNLTDATGDLPGGVLGAVGLSDTGFVTAWKLDSGASSAYRWSARGGVVELLDPPSGIVWADHIGRAVNAEGAVVGLFGTSTGGFSLRSGYRWLDGECDELLTPLGFSGQPNAISDTGWIVGRAGGRPGGTPGAVRWSPLLIPEFVADLDDALDVNVRGEVVGFREDPAGARTARAFLFDGGPLVPLGTLDPSAVGDVYPRALDDLGRVVGSSEIQGVEHAFLWTRAGGMTELPGLGIPSAVPDTAALDVNGAGWIVGYSANANGRTDVLWAPDGTVHELQLLVPAIGSGRPWSQLFTAVRINGSGQIAGTAVRGGVVRAVLLTPAVLGLSAPVPGMAGTSNRLTLDGARPDRRVILVGDFDDPLDAAYTVVPGCRSIGLSLARPRLVAVALPDATGAAAFTWDAPATLSGVTIQLQALQFGACAVSEVVRVTL